MLHNFNKFINEKKVSSSEKIDIYRDDNYIVVEVLSHRASCKYGAFTGWCISHPRDSTAWNAGREGTRVIFIINKNFKPNADKIYKLEYLNDKINNGDATEKDEIKFQKLIQDYSSHDLSKIAIIINDKIKNYQEIWGANNINLSDVYYDYNNLPISDIVKEKLNNYIND